MPTRDDIHWFKTQFASEIGQAIEGTPFTLDLVTAIACQETGPIWSRLRRQGVAVERILALCVGDTIDGVGGRGRRAFPRTKADLTAAPNGAAMFAIARQALIEMSKVVPGFRGVAAKPHKFCHAFGIFQYDLQHYRTDPAYFLEQRYLRFTASLGKCLDELRRALARNGWADRTSLSELELAGVAIAYNAGRYRPQRGLKQGHFDGRLYYGEHIVDFMRLSRTVAAPGSGPAPIAPPPPGHAPVTPPTPIDAVGAVLEVDVRSSLLRVRRTPEIADGNIIARLPDGHLVQARASRAVHGFLEIETSVHGAHIVGFVSRRYLREAPDGAVVPVPAPVPDAPPPATGATAVLMPRRGRTITHRTDAASAHSLNEPRQPTRRGRSPQELRSELSAIVDWLAVDALAHARYRPRGRQTFCNVYAHDYCHLAGVYLPRVWWTPGAIERLGSGHAVEPRYDQTISELRANDLCRWLRDFGVRFGWRQTSTLTKLQVEVNEGAVGLVIARRRDDGRPGHVSVVVPETHDARARRAADGQVVAPLQSQAGSRNFRRGTGRPRWWMDEAFIESAFWLHA